MFHDAITAIWLLRPQFAAPVNYVADFIFPQFILAPAHFRAAFRTGA